MLGLELIKEYNKKNILIRAKSEIKNKIKLIHNPFNIKPNSLYKDSITNKGFLVPEYKSIRSSTNRIVNKMIPKDINDFNDNPYEHEYYNTLNREKFLLEKSETYVIFQSPFQANLHIKYPEKVFL